MGLTLSEQLIESHLVEGRPVKGSEIAIRIDQTLTQDATGTMAYLEFESLGTPQVQTELSVSYVDHNIIQTDFKNADDHLFLQTIAAKYGVVYSPPGNGISHHVHRQRFGVPGKSLLGSDSHTTTGGCLGMLAMGAGGMDVALAMNGRPYYLIMPRIWGIYLTGKLKPWVSGKDVILELLRRYTVKGGLGMIMEFVGPGVAELDMSARATIANMGVDIGATAAVFPSDQVTRDYLRLQGREQDWKPLQAESDASYDRVTELDLSAIEPLVACPHNPDNVKRAEELKGVDISQVIIGSSTNGSYRDIMVAALILEGKTVHSAVSLDINPGSRQVIENVAEMNGFRRLLHAGARIHQPGCLGCIGMGQVPATGTRSLRTMPRNFLGRSGLSQDQVYLCSPETAAASALNGCITDPRTLGQCPQVPYPQRFIYNDRWFIWPPQDAGQVTVRRGPNIKPLPAFHSLEEDIKGEVLIKVGDNISTDIIMPAGNRVLPLRSNIPAISRFVFDILDPHFAERCQQKGGGVVVGGENYGQGSSREHAALAPRYLGIRAKIAKSFARIHRKNLINFGIVPLVLADPKDYELFQQGDMVVIAGIREALRQGRERLDILVKDRRVAVVLSFSSKERDILLAGGILNLARGR